MTKWLVTMISIFIVANLFKLIHVESLAVLVLAALVLGLLNAFVRPMLLLLTLPINILSLGFFTLVINAFLLYVVAGLVPGFEITGFFRAFLAALLVSLINAMTNFLLHREPKITVVKLNDRGRSQG